MRVVRLLFALVMLTTYFTAGDKIALLGALFFGYQAIFNVGCCGAEACYNTVNQTEKQASEISYEEIKKPE